MASSAWTLVQKASTQMELQVSAQDVQQDVHLAILQETVLLVLTVMFITPMRAFSNAQTPSLNTLGTV